ncbi:MAG TPA: cupin domain-containing protein [Streptomyces sp.]
MRTLYRAAVTAAAASALAVLPSTAHATPSSGVSATILAQRTIGGRDFILREITLQPGGTTGWHYHDGTLYAYVKQGTLTHNDHTCATDGVYRAGAAFIEPSGAGHVHLGRNLGTVPVVLDVLYVDPAGSPLSEDAPNPGCPFQ